MTLNKPTEHFDARSAFYKIVDELNGLEAQVWKRIHSKELRAKFKSLKRHTTKLEDFIRSQ